MRAYILAVLSLALWRVDASERVFKYSESVRGATLPFYAPGESRPYAALRVERVFKDYERRGFFRIGLLPLLVGEDVTLRLVQPSRMAEALAMAGRLTKTAANVVEWRNVKLAFADEMVPRLRAARVRPSPDEGWRIWDAVVQTGTNTLQIGDGQLSLKDGELIFVPSNGKGRRINISADPGKQL